DDKWNEAFNKKDAAALTALYTADAVLLPQGVDQPIIGAVNIRKYMARKWLAASSPLRHSARRRRSAANALASTFQIAGDHVPGDAGSNESGRRLPYYD